MKYFKKILLLMLILLPCLSLCACTTNNTENLAKDLDSTVKNLVISVSTLDWPADGDLESFNALEQSSPSQTTSSADTVLVDTQIDTSEIYVWLESTHSKINVLFAKRGDLLLYLNEMYGGNTSLAEEDILSLNVYMNILKDNSNYLNSYNGMLKNQINEAKEIYSSNQNVNLINAYLIKAVETLQLRCAKIDTSILAMTSIIDIIKNNLINNYFSYNEHEIINNVEEEIVEETLPNKNEDPQEDVEEAPQISDENETTEGIEQEETPLTDQSDEYSNIDSQNNINNDIAINFESETVEVDVPEESPTVDISEDSSASSASENETNSETEVNYDHLIKTLEEPQVDDNSDIENNTSNIANARNSDSTAEKESTKETVVDNQTSTQKPNKTETLETTTLQIDSNQTEAVHQNLSEENKDIKEIDKDFAQKPIKNEDNQTVTREIIKENIV